MSDAVSRELEGTWHATPRLNGLTLRAMLTLTNQPGGQGHRACRQRRRAA
jgi:hypothetical protein